MVTRHGNVVRHRRPFGWRTQRVVRAMVAGWASVNPGFSELVIVVTLAVWLAVWLWAA